jgi:signal transduction histidine kinase
VHNGVKYSRPEGVVTIHLSTPAVGVGTASIEVKITDQGIIGHYLAMAKI